jgi:hypothetical protein
MQDKHRTTSWGKQGRRKAAFHSISSKEKLRKKNKIQNRKSTTLRINKLGSKLGEWRRSPHSDEDALCEPDQ